jgi:L-ascorbate metabolism protein UlaG (beta-lactamase superfamily)
MKETIRNKKMQIAAHALACAVLVFAGGCATTSGSSGTAAMKITESERAIDAARHDCVQNASDLKNAELKLTQARAALDAQDYLGAAWRADEATADANYARTKAAQEQAEQSAEQLQKSNARLKNGLNDAKSY